MNPPPAISVLMATYNGARFIRESVHSILAQTFADFELIVVDDGSTDATPAILAAVDDPRLLVLRHETNRGVVAARNHGFARARGEFLALLDHDDLSHPERLALQHAHMRDHPATVLVATAARSLRAGRLLPPREPHRTTPALLDWLLHIANPLVCSSVMLRTAPARTLGTLMRPDFEYADDFDLYHRLREYGAIARLDQPLTTYRLHETNTYVLQQETMQANAAKVLARAYRPWFGDGAERAAHLVSRHLAAGTRVPDAATRAELETWFDRITAEWLARPGVTAVDALLIEAEARALRRRLRPSWRDRARDGFRRLRLAPLAISKAGGGGFPPRPPPISGGTMDEWQQKLTPDQYRVLREHGTERPGSSPLNHEKRAGEYLCAGCDTALFDSGAKYESGSGWPSFYEAKPEAVATTEDRSLGMARVEIHCARCGGHIGHVFPDGPQPSGLRFCTNGAALKFEPGS